tara:strand:- start:29 stop:454 length:426 start_codon:yes stop_codon:yes gene_type:complete
MLKKIFYFISIIILSNCTHSQQNLKSIDFEYFLQLSKSKKFLLIDVRTKNEFNTKRLRNALNIDFYDKNFENNIKMLEKEKNLLIYCRSGRRSLIATEILSKNGYQNVYNLKEGIIALDKYKDYFEPTITKVPSQSSDLQN